MVRRRIERRRQRRVPNRAPPRTGARPIDCGISLIASRLGTRISQTAACSIPDPAGTQILSGHPAAAAASGQSLTAICIEATMRRLADTVPQPVRADRSCHRIGGAPKRRTQAGRTAGRCGLWGRLDARLPIAAVWLSKQIELNRGVARLRCAGCVSSLCRQP